MRTFPQNIVVLFFPTYRIGRKPRTYKPHSQKKSKNDPQPSNKKTTAFDKRVALQTGQMRLPHEYNHCVDSPLSPPAPHPPSSNTFAKVDKVAFLRLLASAFYIILRICRVLFKCRHKPIFLLNVSKYFYCTGKTPGSFVWVDKFLIYQYYRENALVVIFILWFFD